MKPAAASIAVVVSTCLLLTGCAGQQTKLTKDHQLALAAQPQVHAIHHPPSKVFTIDSTGRTLFMPVLLSVYEGMAMQRDLKLEDPALRVKDRLVNALQRDVGLTNVRVVAESPKDQSAETLKATYGSGAVLEVRTRNWGLDNYRAKYSAVARLTRLPDADVLWEATCNDFVVDKGKPAPAMGDLTAKEGELLKIKLQQAADGCAEELVGWLLGKS
jgi:hypothetical protein